MRVDDEILEMILQRELTTGARRSDARSSYDSAGKTPPIPLTGRSAKCGNGRVVPADREVLGQQMQQRPAQRGLAWPAKDLDGRARPRSTTPATTCRRRPESPSKQGLTS